MRERALRTSELVKKMLGMGLTRQQSFELASHFCGIDKSAVLLDREVDEKTCLAAAQEAAAGKPIQYIIGEWDFCGRKILCREGVLIPREDTETIVEVAKKHLTKGDSVLDLCCGSGCISVALASSGAKVCAVDINDKAVELTKENAALWGVQINVRKMNILSEKMDSMFDMIVSNPPYIRTSEIRKLDTSVKKYEPRNALDGGDDGLLFYRAITKGFFNNIADGGMLIFEIGFDQRHQVTALLEGAGFKNVTAVKDLNGNDRVVFGVKQQI